MRLEALYKKNPYLIYIAIASNKIKLDFSSDLIMYLLRTDGWHQVQWKVLEKLTEGMELNPIVKIHLPWQSFLSANSDFFYTHLLLCSTERTG